MGNGKLQVGIAIVAVIGTLGTALFANWDKVFGDENVLEPPGFEKTISEMTVSLAKKTSEIGILKDELDNKKSVISKQQSTLDSNEIEINKLKAPFHKLENTKLKHLLLFHNDASCYGRSLNFTHSADELYKHCVSKEVLAKKFLQFLEELEIIESNNGTDYSRARAKQELINLQDSYMFTTTGWYTEYTLGVLIIEYAKKS